MKVEQQIFEDYLKQLEETEKFISDCKEVTKALEKYAFSSGWELDDEFLTMPNTLSPDAIQKVCKELLKKSPREVIPDFYRKNLIKF